MKPFAGERGGIDIQTVRNNRKEIQEVHSLWVSKLPLVIGGGNLWRGEPAAEAGHGPFRQITLGMLGTVMNALVMADFILRQVGRYVQTAIVMQQVAEPTYVDVPFRHLGAASSLVLELVHLTTIQQQPFVQLK